MSAKNLDKHNRWRNKTVAFRVSPEEDTQIETAVKLTGLTKQELHHPTAALRDVVVQATPGSTRRCGISWPLCWTSCAGSKLDRRKR